MQEIVISLVAAVACRFMQDRHAGRYLGSKRVTILVTVVRNNPARGSKNSCLTEVWQQKWLLVGSGVVPELAARWKRHTIPPHE